MHLLPEPVNTDYMLTTQYYHRFLPAHGPLPLSHPNPTSPTLPPPTMTMLFRPCLRQRPRGVLRACRCTCLSP